MIVRAVISFLVANAATVVANAATLAPVTVPASGRQEVLLTLEAPVARHLSARSASGTSCELIDRVRGPFAQAGTPGGVNCELDLLLDAGQYKVRLESPLRGKGNVALSATPFTEINPAPLRLTDGVGVVTTLKPGQQASYWLDISARDASPVIRIFGRHAGDVRLRRNGQWLEPMTAGHTEFSPIPGQPLHEWRLDSKLEAGEYKLVVYGRGSTTVTGSSIDDSLTVEGGSVTARRSAASLLPCRLRACSRCGCRRGTGPLPRSFLSAAHRNGRSNCSSTGGARARRRPRAASRRTRWCRSAAPRPEARARA
jgi:hypothetical protein